MDFTYKLAAPGKLRGRKLLLIVLLVGGGQTGDVVVARYGFDGYESNTGKQLRFVQGISGRRASPAVTLESCGVISCGAAEGQLRTTYLPWRGRLNERAQCLRAGCHAVGVSKKAGVKVQVRRAWELRDAGVLLSLREIVAGSAAAVASPRPPSACRRGRRSMQSGRHLEALDVTTARSLHVIFAGIRMTSKSN